MKYDAKKDKLLFSYSKRFALLLFIFWTVAVAASLIWNAMQDRRSLIESARIQARIAFEKDIVYRRWNTGHGGVYVPVTDKTQPNPYLSELPDRDIITPGGKWLTLMNPAYMTRQVYELGDEAYSLRSHITSLKPIRRENAADPWETEALKAFESGLMEISSIEQLDGVAYMRLMKPLFTEKRCLKCHAKQGYREGDIRGGISVSIPMKPLWAIMRTDLVSMTLVHSLLWLLGIGGIYAGLVWFKRSERKRTQAVEALKESAFFLKESQSIAHLGSYALDITTGFWTSSDILDQIFGIGSDYVRNVEGWSEIVHPDEREEMLNYFNQQVLTEHQPFDREYRILRINDQQERWVHGLGKLDFDENGNPVKMIGTIQDITERKKAEEELMKTVDLDIRKAEELEKSYAELKQSQNAAMNLMEDLRTEISEREKLLEELKTTQEYAQNLIDSSLDMIIAVDKRRRITEFNRSAETTFGYKREEVLGKHINMLYADAEVGRKVHTSTVRKGQHVEEVWNKRKNGKVFPSLLSASILRNAEGEVVGVMGVSRDITKQKAAEQNLQESEEKFRSVIEQSNDGIYVLQGNRFVFINSRFTEITGYELKEISGEDFDFMELVAEEGHKILEEREAMRKRGEEPPSRYVFKGLRKDGQKRDLEVSVTTVEWQGAPAMLGVLHDVTERIQTRTELEHALEKAQEGEKVKSLFLANMSHEIRTPLNSILGFTDLIEESVKHKIEPEEQTFFNSVRSSGKRLMNTVHEILDMSQIEAGILAVDIKELDLIKVANETIASLIPQAESKGLKLSFTSNLSNAIIKGDQYCIVQALTNILENAIKYTNEGRIDISLNEKDSQLILSIKDTGIGISPEYLDEIFDVFTQESTGYTKKFQGVGLGLALSRRYLDLCHAIIDVESKKGVGSTFTLTFQKVKKAPPKKVKNQKVEIQKVPTPEVEKKPLVLVVEDDLNSQKLISFYLKQQYDTSFAVSVEEAKEKLKSEPVAVILLDLSLFGEEDGLDLTRYLRKTKKWKELPIIVTTAHAFDTDRENCLEAGCNDYMAKPLKQKDLIERLKKWV